MEKFQTDAHKLLEEEDPEASDIEACVDFGLSLEIELTELAQLKEKQKQVKLVRKGTTFNLDNWGPIRGATTFSITTLGITTFSITTLCIPS